MHAGTIAQLWRYPVKSMAGESVRSTRVDWRGVGGDRTHAVWWEHKDRRQPATAVLAPRLLRWHASYPFAPDGGLDPDDPPPAQVISPDGERFVFPDPRLRERLSEELGRDVELYRDVDGQQDVGSSLLVTVAGSLDVLSRELGRAVDVRRFRSNLHLELDSPPFAEAAWEGGLLTFEGGVTMRLSEPCDRCVIPTRDPETLEGWGELLRHINIAHGTFFGIRARVETGGHIAVGQSVSVQPPS